MNQHFPLGPMIPGSGPSSACANYFETPFRDFASLARPGAIPINVEFKNRKISAAFSQFMGRIELLHSLLDNWDGNGSAKPKSTSIRNAKLWGKKIYFIVLDNNYEWRIPFISVDEEGDVVFEWWYQDRNLTLDISARSVTFSETRDADSTPKITMGKLTNRTLPLKLRWLIIGA